MYYTRYYTVLCFFGKIEISCICVQFFWSSNHCQLLPPLCHSRYSHALRFKLDIPQTLGYKFVCILFKQGILYENLLCIWNWSKDMNCEFTVCTQIVDCNFGCTEVVQCTCCRMCNICRLYASGSILICHFNQLIQLGQCSDWVVGATTKEMGRSETVFCSSQCPAFCGISTRRYFPREKWAEYNAVAT